MPTPKRAALRARFLPSRFVLQVALGALIVLGLIASIVSCAASRDASETFGTTSSPLVIAGLFATGVDNTGTPLPIGSVDPHYTLSSNVPAQPGPNALVVAPVSGWTANTATSTWLSAQANAIGANLGQYTYTTTFTLAGVDVTTASINGTWACDDSCVLSLNGTVVAMNTAPAWTAPTAFSIPAGSPFVAGTNTLQFVATNSGGGATGLQILSISGTTAGCTADNQCTLAQFCNTQTGTCVGTLPSGTMIPTISGHTPVLDGVCATGVGPSVCDAGVCDMSNDECGYANGDGPCTPATGFTICQSGACSLNGTCEPSGGCYVDGDCTGGKTCDTTTDTCVAPLDAGEGEGEGGSDDGSAGTGDGGSQDGSVGADGSEGTDGSAIADGSEGDTSLDGTANPDGTAVDGATIGDGSLEADAPEEDGAIKGDGAPSTSDGGPTVRKDLEGGGLGCSASRPAPFESGLAPLSMLALVAAAAFGRIRSRRPAGDRHE
jgi:hypothetical protein